MNLDQAQALKQAKKDELERQIAATRAAIQRRQAHLAVLEATLARLQAETRP